MDEKIKVALTQADTTLLLESLTYRLMGLEATGTNPQVSTARAVKKEAIVAIISALDSARRTAAPVLSVSTHISS